MTSNKGFSLVETLVAASLIMMMVMTIVPLTSLLLKERESLQQKQTLIHELQYELQPFLRGSDQDLPYFQTKTVNNVQADFKISQEKRLLKGCVTWENANERTDKYCLYGYTEN